MKKKVSIVAGGAGFIGINLLQHLIEEDTSLVVIDNLCRGKIEFIRKIEGSKRQNIRFENFDLSDLFLTRSFFEELSVNNEIIEIWHLAANSDIPAGIFDTSIDLRDTFLTTYSLIQMAREYKISKFHFASSSAVYGDHQNKILSESNGPMKPISNYGAMKLASEALISAAVEGFLEVGNIFRFPNVVGAPATHGVIFDFIEKLKVSPEVLDVLGDGTQQKCYLHVDDLINAMLHIRACCEFGCNIFNIGPLDDGISVKNISEIVRNIVSPNAKIKFGIGNKGWVGDVPKFRYSINELQALGWSPKMNSFEAINKSAQQIYNQTKMS